MNNSTYMYDDFFSLENTLPVICVSTLLFLAAILLVIAFKLYRLLVYLLALYQVISAKNLLVFLILFIYDTLPNRLELSFTLSLIPLKVVLTVWIVFHLFALSVFHKNLKRLELLYVVSSVVIAIVIFILMMTLNDAIVESYSYNVFNVSYNGSDTIHGPFKIETVLFYLGIILLVVSSVLVIIMLVTLCCRPFKAKNGIVLEYHKQHKKVLYEMLPLLVYIIFYLVVMFPILSILVVTDPDFNDTIQFSMAEILFDYFEFFFEMFGAPIAIVLWSIGCSSTFIIPILIVQCYKKHKKKIKLPTQ